MGPNNPGIGETLRLERLRQKRSIDDIARETRIPARMLEAIEREDFAALPALVFARNFVKQYAAAVELDPETLVAAMPAPDVFAMPLPDPHQRAKPSIGWDPAWNGVASSLGWLAVILTAAVLAYIHFNRPLEMRATSAPAPIAVTQPPVHGSANAAQANTIQPDTPARTVAEPQRAAAQSTAEPGTAVQTVSSDDAGAAAAAEPGNSNRKVNVSISAHADAWIQVASDGRTVFTGILKPNESKEFSADQSVKLIAGNAGGINVELNGRMLDPLGAAGQVKIVRLTEEGPQTVVANREPDSNRL